MDRFGGAGVSLRLHRAGIMNVVAAGGGAPLGVLGSPSGQIFTDAAASRNVNFDVAPSAGEFLFVAVASRQTQILASTPGWVRAFHVKHPQTTRWQAVFVKVAVGGDAFAYETASAADDQVPEADRSSYIALRTGGGAQNIEIAFSTTSVTGPPNPPLLTPSGGNREYLWLSTVMSSDAGSEITNAPTGYSGLFKVSTASSVSARQAVAHRVLTAASEDPGVWAPDITQYLATTIAVW